MRLESSRGLECSLLIVPRVGQSRPRGVLVDLSTALGGPDRAYAVQIAREVVLVGHDQLLEFLLALFFEELYL